MGDETTLKKIDAKLGALLAIALDQHLRETGVARPKSRSIDRLLTDAGLTAREIAALLGKTERAVHLALQSERKAKGARQKARTEEPSSDEGV